MKAAPGNEQRIALSISALVFGFATSMTYLFERLYERLRNGKIDPRDILAEAHAMFYWRSFLAVWWGGFIAALVYRWLMRGDRDVPRFVGRLTWALLVLSPFAALWAYRFP